jgi:hypothetical protein
VKFGFIAKHRRIWPADWLCEALGVSRGGFYAWLTRPRSQRSRSDDELGAKVRASFLASDRTYGARRVWRDLLAEAVWWRCHRRIIADYLLAAGERVIHILGTSRVEEAHLTPGAIIRDDETVVYPAGRAQPA